MSQEKAAILGELTVALDAIPVPPLIRVIMSYVSPPIRVITTRDSVVQDWDEEKQVLINTRLVTPQWGTGPSYGEPGFLVVGGKIVMFQTAWWWSIFDPTRNVFDNANNDKYGEGPQVHGKYSLTSDGDTIYRIRSDAGTDEPCDELDTFRLDQSSKIRFLTSEPLKGLPTGETLPVVCYDRRLYILNRHRPASPQETVWGSLCDVWVRDEDGSLKQSKSFGTMGHSGRRGIYIVGSGAYAHVVVTIHSSGVYSCKVSELFGNKNMWKWIQSPGVDAGETVSVNRDSTVSYYDNWITRMYYCHTSDRIVCDESEKQSISFRGRRLVSGVWF